MMSHVDLHLFWVINRDLSNAVFDVIMPFVTDPGHFEIPLAALGIGLIIWGGRKGRIMVVMALALLFVSNAASEGLKLWVQRPRPCLTLEAARLLVGCSPESFSFPSGHATNVTAQAVLFASAYRSLSIPLILLAAAVGYSRVYVGVHYPADVVGGVVLGLICAAVFILLERLVERRFSSPIRNPESEVHSPQYEI